MLNDLVDQLEKANPFVSTDKHTPEYVADNCIGYEMAVKNLKQLLSQQSEKEYKLPGHDETVNSLNNLTIKSKEEQKP